MHTYSLYMSCWCIYHWKNEHSEWVRFLIQNNECTNTIQSTFLWYGVYYIETYMYHFFHMQKILLTPLILARTHLHMKIYNVFSENISVSKTVVMYLTLLCKCLVITVSYRCFQYICWLLSLVEAITVWSVTNQIQSWQN